MEVRPRDRAKNKYHNNPLNEYEYLSKNIFEGDGFQIESFEPAISEKAFNRTTKFKKNRKPENLDTT
jgi:hypothetical protein